MRLKIKNVEVIKDVPVFDIEMPSNNNFVLDSGAVASNCAHSSSYAIVSYNCAYLKFKYPLEFWAAELSCEFDNEDKLRHYAEFLGDMILQPDILFSHPTDFIIENDKLRAPLSLLKGVGITVVEDIQRIIRNEVSDLNLQRKGSVA
jgi:DNA polymerase III alpha subunit